MSLLEKGSIYNQPSVYNQGEGGGGGTPDGYRFYTKIVFKGTTDFNNSQKKALLKNIKYDDVIYFAFSFVPSKVSGYTFDINFQERRGWSYFRRTGHVQNNSTTAKFINEYTQSANTIPFNSTLYNCLTKMTSTYAMFNGAFQINVDISNYDYTIETLGPWQAPAEIYYLKIYDSTEETIKFDLFPALQIDTGKKGLYDKVSNTFIEANDQTSNTVLFGPIE